MSKSVFFLYSLSLLALLPSCSHVDADLTRTTTYTVEERPQSAAELRAELLQREQSAPGDYLQVRGTYRRNFIDQLVLEGNIVNAATLARFKDPVVSVSWYSQTQTELATKQYPVYEFLRPQGSTHFKFKTNAPGEVATVAMSITSATPIE